MTAARIDEVRIILRYVLVVTILFAKPFILPRGNRGLDIAVTKEKRREQDRRTIVTRLFGCLDPFGFGTSTYNMG